VKYVENVGNFVWKSELCSLSETDIWCRIVKSVPAFLKGDSRVDDKQLLFTKIKAKKIYVA
jgi:hypothetical protein